MKLPRGVWLNAGIGVLAGASLVLVWATRDVTPSTGSEEYDQSLFPAFRGEDALRVELTGPGPKVVIERSAPDAGSAVFLLVEPVKERADAATVDKFLSALAHARALRPVEPGPSLKSLGLDAPRQQIAIRNAKRSYHLALGGPAPTPEGARYVQVSSNDEPPSVRVVSKTVFDELSLELDAFRLRSLVPIGEADVTRIRITGAELDLTLRRTSGSSFLIDGEPKVLADRETVKSLFFQLSRLTASKFLSVAEAEAALGKEHAHFELESKDPKQTVVFDAGGSCPGNAAELVLVRRSPDPQGACAARELEATLRLKKSDFLDRHAFSLHLDEVEELDITGAKEKFSLVRKGSGFVLHAHADSQVELEAGNQRISALLEAEGERVDPAALSELGLAPAQGTIVLHSSAARDERVIQQTLRVGKQDVTGNLLVYREQDGAVLRMPREQARAFRVDSTLLYSRKLSEFGLSSFISAEIERNRDRQILRRGTNQELELDVPKGFTPDGVLSSDLIQALGALTAERFVSDRDDGTFGFAHSSLSVRFAFKNAEGTKTERRLRFGDETSLGVFATLDDGGPVFVLARSVRDTCDTLLVNRAVYPGSESALTAITLEAQSRALRLERKGERFVAVSPSAFPQDRVADLLEALSNLRPEAGLHTGSPTLAEGFSKPTLTLHLTPKVGPAQTLTFGAGDAWRSTSVFYLRVSGTDATYVIAQSKVRALSDAL